MVILQLKDLKRQLVEEVKFVRCARNKIRHFCSFFVVERTKTHTEILLLSEILYYQARRT